MDISFMRAKYLPEPEYKHTDDPLLDGMVDTDQVNLEYPVDEFYNMRQASVVRALNARTTQVVRQHLLQNIEELPSSSMDPKLSDDDKLSLMKSRYHQSRPELAAYREYLETTINEDVKLHEAQPSPDSATESQDDSNPDSASTQ